MAEAGLSVAAVVLAACVVVWASGEIGGRLAHGAWPSLGPGDIPIVGLSLLQHPADPGAGWPAGARRLAPPAWLDYGLLGLLAGAAGGVSWIAVGRAWSTSPDLRGMRRAPAGLRQRSGRWLQQRPFLGWSGAGPFAAPLMGTPVDCVAVVGPPQVRKTRGVLIPNALRWDGPVVATSTKRGDWTSTFAGRRGVASVHGGRVMLWAPTMKPHAHDGVEDVGWSPLTGCDAAETCERRVRALVTASGAGQGVRNADHWRDNAISLLRGYFHAAAISDQGVMGVMRWLARNELKEPAIILAQAGSVEAEEWAEELEGLSRVPAEELGSIFSAARTSTAALRNGRVRASCTSSHTVDTDQFLVSRSTLYVVAPTADQALLAPLVAAMVEHFVQRAYELWEEGRLGGRLLLLLDELANIAPLPSLLEILTQGSSQSVNLVWAVQSLAQLRNRYGEQVADAAFSSSRARLVFGGLTDTRDLQAISQLAGEHEVASHSATRGVQYSQHSATTGSVWRPRLPVSAIRGIPTGRAVLLYHTSDPALVRVPLGMRSSRSIVRRAVDLIGRGRATG